MMKKPRKTSGGMMLAAAGLGMTVLAGCRIDCDERYCDFVRAGAAGIFAWEYDCCLNPDSDACIDRAMRYQRLAFNAPLMRMACEDRNWDRIGELWDEVKAVIPAMPLRVILRDFCGFDVLVGENVATPWEMNDSVVLDIGLRPSLGNPPLRPARPGSGQSPASSMAPPHENSSWVVNGGSTLRVDSRGWSAAFAAAGRFAVEPLVDEDTGRRAADEVDEWCRKLRPVDFQMQLEGSAGTVSLSLDPDFPGNTMSFTAPDRGVIGVAVRMNVEAALPPIIGIHFDLEEAYLTLPFTVSAGGELRLGGNGAIDAMSIWPVAPALQDYIRGVTPKNIIDDESVRCANAARQVAEHFLALHAGECGLEVGD